MLSHPSLPLSRAWRTTGGATPAGVTGTHRPLGVLALRSTLRTAGLGLRTGEACEAVPLGRLDEFGGADLVEFVLEHVVSLVTISAALAERFPRCLDFRLPGGCGTSGECRMFVGRASLGAAHGVP